MVKYLFVMVVYFFAIACGDSPPQNGDKVKKVDEYFSKKQKNVPPEEDRGIGPITSIELGDLDKKLADEGEELFKSKCSACHKVDKKFIGPKMAGVASKRTPEWIMNMILNPEKMVKENEEAKKLLIEFNGSPMANQNLTQQEARSILEFLRTIK